MWSYLVDGLMTIDHPHQYYGGRTYAQHGDDLILLNLFNSMGIERPSYLDIGAHHPYEISNTALLYERGSRGINVEANPDLIEAFRTLRPEDTNLNVGVGARPGQCTFYRSHNTCGRNSFVKSAMDDIGITSEVVVEIRTVAQILRDHASGIFPDLLSVDIEGWDLQVFETMDFRNSAPKVIVAEAQGAASAAIRDLLTARGFAFHFRAGGNAIFVRRDYLDSVEQ
jgi:FkbM family methyltransferase